MLFFVKDNILHRFPVPKRCGVKRNKETIKQKGFIPHGVEDCVYCMRRRPEEVSMTKV